MIMVWVFVVTPTLGQERVYSGLNLSRDRERIGKAGFEETQDEIESQDTCCHCLLERGSNVSVENVVNVMIKGQGATRTIRADYSRVHGVGIGLDEYGLFVWGGF
jgi:hypothetical protein